jgi:hypothetical protein
MVSKSARNARGAHEEPSTVLPLRDDLIKLSTFIILQLGAQDFLLALQMTTQIE